MSRIFTGKLTSQTTFQFIESQLNSLKRINNDLVSILSMIYG